MLFISIHKYHKPPSLRMANRVVLLGIESITSENIKQSPVIHWALRNFIRPTDKIILIHGTKHLDTNTAKAAGYTEGRN